jgi:hypothetical protein
MIKERYVNIEVARLLRDKGLMRIVIPIMIAMIL